MAPISTPPVDSPPPSPGSTSSSASRATPSIWPPPPARAASPRFSCPTRKPPAIGSSKSDSRRRRARERLTRRPPRTHHRDRQKSNRSSGGPLNLRRFFSTAILLAASLHLVAAPNPAWTNPFPPFRIAGNLYYVGSEDLASYLIVTPQGDILINSSLESSVPLIRKSVETLGFKFSDIKILLISHAHYDHCAGSARIKQLTGARYYVMDADVSVVESGGKTDFNYGADPAIDRKSTRLNSS